MKRKVILSGLGILIILATVLVMVRLIPQSTTKTPSKESMDMAKSVPVNQNVPAKPPTAVATSGAINIQLPNHPRPKAPAKTPVAKPTSASTPPPSTGSSAPPPVSSSGNWTLVMTDEFNGSSLSSSWGAYGGTHGGGQNAYDPGQVTVNNGLLHITMEKKSMNGQPYTSGGVGAFNNTQIYGKYEMRVKLPHGKGLDPYAILWPKDPSPDVIQVDIFESPPVNKDKLYFTNHGPGGNSTQVIANGDFADNFHVLTCEWTPGKLRFLVDGVEQGTLTSGIPAQPMWFGMAMSTGDAFTGLPDGATVFPATMEVDWVRIYKYS